MQAYKITNAIDSEISYKLILRPNSLCTEGLGTISWETLDVNDMEYFTIQK